MIDYDQPDEDPIVAEVRRAREEYAAKFNYDLDAIFADLKRREAAGSRKYVSLPPRRIEPPSAPAKKVG
jgi:hypothetical protein